MTCESNQCRSASCSGGVGKVSRCRPALQELSASSSSAPDGRAGSARPPGPGTPGRPATAQRWQPPRLVVRVRPDLNTTVHEPPNRPQEQERRSDRPWAFRVTRRNSCSRCFWWARARRDGSTGSPRATTGANTSPSHVTGSSFDVTWRGSPRSKTGTSGAWWLQDGAEPQPGASSGVRPQPHGTGRPACTVWNQQRAATRSPDQHHRVHA